MTGEGLKPLVETAGLDREATKARPEGRPKSGDMTQDTPSVAASEGDWIEWNGGECPVPNGATFQRRYRDGIEQTVRPSYGHVYEAALHDDLWTVGDGNTDIIAYRIVRTALQEQSE